MVKRVLFSLMFAEAAKNTSHVLVQLMAKPKHALSEIMS